ncbi:hypothetical protein GQ53DRAFT_832224 [Thozetella sp. PMI_491]|nr:hypothetical protein GQ53DRAFT_832224 [Thozetella sp. PMI_491]
MRYSISTLAFLLVRASSAALQSPAAVPNVVQFRVYGESGCNQQNEGYFTFRKEEVGGCKDFKSYNVTVESYILQDLASNYSIQFWANEGCTGETDRFTAAGNTCTNRSEKSFTVFST